MAQTDDLIVDALCELGLSQYEAKLYFALLKQGRQNGNELSRTSGVPSSKVYAMLERLASAGIVAQMRQGHTVEYVGIAPRDLLHKLRERYMEPLGYLEKALPKVVSPDPEPETVQLGSLDAILDSAKALLRHVEHEVYLSVWRSTLEPLLGDLEAASQRNVRIFGMLYGGEPPGFGSWLQHSYQETVFSRISGRMLTIVVDAEEAIIAHLPENGEPGAVRTRNPTLCLVTEEYMIHDQTLQRAKMMTGYQEWDAWLRSDEQVRQMTLGRTGHLSPIEPTVEARG